MTIPDPISAPARRHIGSAEQKLGLEIEELRAKLGWDRWIGHVIALVSCCVLVLGAVTGVIQYRANRTLEFERRFWEKQLDVYARLSASGAALATSRRDSVAGPYTAFAALYYGEFSLVADSSAKASGKRFLQRAAGYRGGDVMQDGLLSDAGTMSLELRTALSRSAVSPLHPRNPSDGK